MLLWKLKSHFLGSNRIILRPSRINGHDSLAVRRYHGSEVLRGGGIKKRTPDAHLIGSTLKIPALIRAKDLSKKLGIDLDRVEKFAREEKLFFRKVSEIIIPFNLTSKFLATFNINSEYEEVDAVRSDYWSTDEKQRDYPTRPSVISVMGEIDHGKTSLLDALSDSYVVAYEPGKITQSLSAFTVDLEPEKNVLGEIETEIKNNVWSKSRVTFLDTPGHAAFENMRQSGAQVSDFVLLVISAVDGVKPQTETIIKMTKKKFVPIVVVINKIDIATEKHIKLVYKQLRLLGVSKMKRSKNPAMQKMYKKLFDEVDDSFPVVAIVEISATLKTNIDILKIVIKNLHLSMEDNLHANPAIEPAEATVIESYSTPGLGRVLLLITHLGTLKLGSHFITDQFIGTIKSLRLADARHLSLETKSLNECKKTFNDINLNIKVDESNRNSKEILKGSIGTTINMESAGPGLPVLVSGLKTEGNVPSGAPFFQFGNKAQVEAVHEFRQMLIQYKIRESQGTLLKPDFFWKKSKEDVLSDEEIKELEKSEEERNNLSIVIKADNQGRLDAILKSSREMARTMGFELKIIASGLGDVTTKDLSVAQVEFEENKVPRVPFLLFNTSLDAKAHAWINQNLASSQAFEINEYNVFLDLLNQIKHEIQLKTERMQQIQRMKANRPNKLVTSSSKRAKRPTPSRTEFLRKQKESSSTPVLRKKSTPQKRKK